jgi:bifunctional oligoribonuclease and PAP phosphatase NrnA
MTETLSHLLVPEHRRAGARDVADALLKAKRIVMTTHVNADGDGIGSETALVHLLLAHGKNVAIANPTPLPERYRFLTDALGKAERTGEAVQAIRDADLFVVLDIADLGRLGHLAEAIRARGIPTACIDHHVSPGTLPDGPRLVDAAASATAELVYDLAVTVQWPVTTDVARALYVGLLTDTGGFRFGNTTPRVLRVAADLLENGVNPERVYEQVYATAPVGRIKLTAVVLDTLVHEPEYGLTWVTVPEGVLERFEVTADDLDGLVEFARSIQGTRCALLFRKLASGKVKVSFRSVGDFDVAEFAHRFGGGGHAKASGASIDGTLDEVKARVLDEARTALGVRGTAAAPPPPPLGKVPA